MAMNDKTAGFTLIELVIVIVILAILAVTVSMLFTNVPNLYAQAAMVASDIRYAQSLSLTHGSRYTFVVLSSTSYTIQNSSGTAITMPSGSSAASLGSGISFGTRSGFASTITFDTRGTPYADSSSTPLSTTATIALVQGRNTATVTINPETGWISS